MPLSADESRPISSGRAERSGMRTRPGENLRFCFSEPISAAAARSESGFAMVEASTSERPIETRMAMTNICSTCSRSARTRRSISPAAEVTATMPTTSSPCAICVATEKIVLPCASVPVLIWVPSCSASETRAEARLSLLSLPSAGGSREKTPDITSQIELRKSVMTVERSSRARSAKGAPGRDWPMVVALRLPVRSSTKTSTAVGSSRLASVPGTSSPSPVARFTGASRGNCASNTSAMRLASTTRPRSRWKTRLSRNGLRKRTPATRTRIARRLKVMILRASGERLIEMIPRRPRCARSSVSAAASAPTQSSPSTTSASLEDFAPSTFYPDASTSLLFVVAIPDTIKRFDCREILVNHPHLLAKPLDVAVDRSVIDIYLIVIGDVHQLIARLHEARALGEGLQQQELGDRQRDIPALPGYCVAQRVHPQFAAQQDLAGFARLALHIAGDHFLAAQERADAFDQQALGERFLDVIVRPHAQAEDLVDLVVLRGEEDDRHRGFLPDALEQIHPVHPGHLDVEHGHVRELLGESVQRGLPVVVGLDLETLGLERHRHRRQNVSVVVDQCDPRHRLFPSTALAARCLTQALRLFSGIIVCGFGRINRKRESCSLTDRKMTGFCKEWLNYLTYHPCSL